MGSLLQSILQLSFYCSYLLLFVSVFGRILWKVNVYSATNWGTLVVLFILFPTLKNYIKGEK